MKKNIVTVFVVLGLSCLAWAQGITVTSPNGGETLVLGQQWPIAWTANVTVKVKIQLIRPGGAIVGVIGTNLASDSSPHPWAIGQTAAGIAPAGSYKVRVIAVDGSSQDASDNAFMIAAGEQPPANPPAVFHPLHESAAPVGLKFPRIEVSDIGLAHNTDGFAIHFNYRNAGNTPWPKASEVPVKPHYRVLVDNTDMTQGELHIPAFPAQPGWEQFGYFGGQILLPTLGLLIHKTSGSVYNENALLFKWHVGDKVKVMANEYKVMGMDMHTLIKDLEPMALAEGMYDLKLLEVYYDWNTQILKITVALDGKVPPNGSFDLMCYQDSPPGSPDPLLYLVKQPMDKRVFVFTKKVEMRFAVDFARFYVYVVGNMAAPQLRIGDVDMRNNLYKYECSRLPATMR
jgi:hypothetical protein